MPGESSMFPFDIPKELYQSFLITYGASSVGRMAIEAYKQLVVLETAWYDVPTATISVLEQGFVQHGLLALAAAEVLNMVLGAIYKNKVRKEARAEGLTEGKAEGKAEGLAEGKAEGKAEGLAEGKAEGRAASNRAWREWLRRKAETEANGQVFTEPMPGDEPAATER